MLLLCGEVRNGFYQFPLALCTFCLPAGVLPQAFWPAHLWTGGRPPSVRPWAGTSSLLKLWVEGAGVGTVPCVASLRSWSVCFLSRICFQFPFLGRLEAVAWLWGAGRPSGCLTTSEVTFSLSSPGDSALWVELILCFLHLRLGACLPHLSFYHPLSSFWSFLAVGLLSPPSTLYCDFEGVSGLTKVDAYAQWAFHLEVTLFNL